MMLPLLLTTTAALPAKAALPAFPPYYTAQFIKGASCNYYEYSHEVTEKVAATGRIFVIPGAKRVDTWPSDDVLDTSNPVSPDHATSTLSINSSAPSDCHAELEHAHLQANECSRLLQANECNRLIACRNHLICVLSRSVAGSL